MQYQLQPLRKITRGTIVRAIGPREGLAEAASSAPNPFLVTRVSRLDELNGSLALTYISTEGARTEANYDSGLWFAVDDAASKVQA